METAHTPNGIMLVWHRTPAQPADLELPFIAGATPVRSYVYRVRDRKRRDLIRYAQACFTTRRAASELVVFYRRALGSGVKQEPGAAPGEILLSAGSEDNFRLVTLTPRDEGYALVLERVRKYTIPPRVYTAAEQKVVAILDALHQAYAATSAIDLTIEQHVESPTYSATDQENSRIHWRFVFTRPDQLSVRAIMRDVEALRIDTVNDELVVTRPNAKEERRSLAKGLTPELLPELYGDPYEDPLGDPVVRMLLGAPLFTPAIDYLMVQEGPDGAGRPLSQVVLTYPDFGMKLWLDFDHATNQIQRSTIEMTKEGETFRVLRAYTVNLPTLPTAPPPPQDSPAAPPAGGS